MRKSSNPLLLLLLTFIVVLRDFPNTWPQNLVGQNGQRPSTDLGYAAPVIRDFSDIATAAYFAAYNKPVQIGKDKEARPPMFVELQFQTVPEETRQAVVSCLVYYGISDLPSGDGITFPIGTFGYEVLLGTNPIGWIAQFLTKQKWKLGDGVIGSITVRDSGNTQNKAAQEGHIEDKTPFFTLYVQRDTKLLSTARDENIAFEARRQRPFTPYQPHGSLASKKGPFWPYPMRIVRKSDSQASKDQKSDGAGHPGDQAGPSKKPKTSDGGSSPSQKLSPAQAPPGARPPAQGQTGSTGTQVSGKGKQRVQTPSSGSAQGQPGAPQYQYNQVPQWQYEQHGSIGPGKAPQQAGSQSPGAAQPGRVASSPPDFTQGEQQRARGVFFNLRQEGTPAAEAVNQMVAAWMRNNPDRFSSQLEAEYVLRLMLGITQTKETKKYLHGN